MSKTPRLDGPKALEFFAGVGLARLVLEAAGITVAWANDIDPVKAEMYSRHFLEPAGERYLLADVRDVRAHDIPPGAVIAWASSPCTDLSLAGARLGLAGRESGVFWQYIRILEEMGPLRPPVAVLENVVGLATSNQGRDLASAIRAFNSLGYAVDLLIIDARRFCPQSRRRLFVIACADARDERGGAERCDLRPPLLTPFFAEPSLTTFRSRLPDLPAARSEGLGRLVESLGASEDHLWWPPERVADFTASLSDVQRSRVMALTSGKDVFYRSAFRRTRSGRAVWETRSDDIAGCLRTTRGGSSRQALVRLGLGRLDVRWMTPREYAALMGAPNYNLASIRPNAALFAFGDGVVVPVVEWLARHCLLPLATGASHRFT